LCFEKKEGKKKTNFIKMDEKSEDGKRKKEKKGCKRKGKENACN